MLTFVVLGSNLCIPLQCIKKYCLKFYLLLHPLLFKFCVMMITKSKGVFKKLSMFIVYLCFVKQIGTSKKKGKMDKQNGKGEGQFIVLNAA